MQPATGDGAAATATSSDNAPCPTGRAAAPRVAVRSPRPERYTLPCLPSRTRQTGRLFQRTGELGQHAPVRTGSARHREPLVASGHERSRPTCKNRRSQGLPAEDLGRWNGAGASSSLPPGCRAQSGRLPTRQVVAKGGPRPVRELMPPPAGPNHVSSSPAVPFACHIGRTTLVSSGQPRSLSPHQ
jgi:hypothetical protein